MNQYFMVLCQPQASNLALHMLRKKNAFNRPTQPARGLTAHAMEVWWVDLTWSAFAGCDCLYSWLQQGGLWLFSWRVFFWRGAVGCCWRVFPVAFCWCCLLCLLKGYRPCRRPQQYGGGGQRSSDACFSISSQMVKSERLDSSYSWCEKYGNI